MPRKNHKWGTRHLAAPIRDVGAAGPRESFAEAHYRCGFAETWQCEGISGLYPFLRKILAGVAKKFADDRARVFAEASAYAQGYSPKRPGDRAKFLPRFLIVRPAGDRLRFHLRIEEKTMTADEYEKLPTVDRGRLMECPQCGEILSLEELLLHLAYKHAGVSKA